MNIGLRLDYGLRLKHGPRPVGGSRCIISSLQCMFRSHSSTSYNYSRYTSIIALALRLRPREDVVLATCACHTLYHPGASATAAAAASAALWVVGLLLAVVISYRPRSCSCKATCPSSEPSCAFPRANLSRARCRTSYLHVSLVDRLKR
eukprot:SAG25_NODE_91_length_16078_cov_7.663058_2_plen_149_part_00